LRYSLSTAYSPPILKKDINKGTGGGLTAGGQQLMEGKSIAQEWEGAYTSGVNELHAQPPRSPSDALCSTIPAVDLNIAHFFIPKTPLQGKKQAIFADVIV
jgi:hypothetical protein